jgi:ribosomal-protein-serine acetyltransferase
MPLNRITISVAIENQRSRAIPERLGLRAEGVIREAEWLDDHFVDQVRYALIRFDWHGSPAAI